MYDGCINCSCKYKEAFKTNNIPMIIADANTGSIRDANGSALEYYDYSKEILLNMNISQINILTDKEIHEEIEIAKVEKRGYYRFKHILSNGEIKDVNVYSDILKIEEEDLLFLMIHDADKKRESERRYLIDKAHFENLFNNSGEAIAIIDNNYRVVNVNNSFKELFQYDLNEIRNKELVKIVVDERHYSKSFKFLTSISNGKFVKEEVKRRRKDGILIDVLLMGFPLLMEGELIGAYCIYTDITESKEKENQIQILSSRDTLTGLYNRDYFLEILNLEITKYNKRKNPDKFLIASLSVNEYAEINDALGHRVADNILREFSSRLEALIQPQDFIARYSEGMFLILMSNATDSNRITKAIKETMKGLNTHFLIDNHDLNITTNIGIAVFPDDGKDSVTLVRNADIALNKSKKNGADRAFLFEDSLDNEIQEYFWMKNDLFRAIELDELFLNYQPIYDTKTNKLVGTEALIRWNHKHKGIIPPLKFIPISEKTGLIYDIGEWVLYTACKQNKLWQDLEYNPIYISVNVSVLQLEQSDFYDKVVKILDATGLEPKYLQLEITETYFKENYELISKNMKRLSELGIGFAIDDFGTGYSSLGQLTELKINTLKIDRMFIDRVDSNINNSKIVKAVISLAVSLNIGLTAEGVERKEELGFLKENKCDVVQGYLFSKPVDSSEIPKYLNK